VIPHGRKVKVEMGTKQPALSFRDLLVWQKSIQLATSIYRLTREFPKNEIFGLTSQMRRSAVSIASNIAEGQGRLSSAEFQRFLGIARGSVFELQTQMEISRSLEINNARAIDEAEALSCEVGKMINGLLKSLKREPSTLTPNH
jgi:four helix bundle protein